MRNDNVAPDFRAVAYDETRYYQIDLEDKPLIKSIWGVYLYNKNEYTYCCELTPSYSMEPLYTYIIYQDDLSEDQIDRLDNKYAHEGMEHVYRHVSDVNHYVDSNPKLSASYGPADNQDEVIEYWAGNPPL